MRAPASAPVSPVPFPALTEADLSALWEGQRFPPEALSSVETGPLRVVYRGRRTGGPGPDFRDAIISTSRELLQGDVELHVRSSDFRRHGHHQDPAYDGLALHVVFRHDEPLPTALASGRRVPVAALGDWAAVRGEELRKRLAGPPLWQEPCYSATQRLTADGAAAALDRLGDMRFRQKAVAARRELQSWNRERGRLQALDEVLWAGVLNALGYGGQRELFGAVAAGLPWHECAGAVAGARSRERPLLAYQMLLRSLDAARLRLPVVLRPLRPGNRPEARLKGAAALAARYARRGLWAGVAPQVPEAAAGRPAALIRAFSVPGAVGRARALEIVANAVLPVAAAAGEAEAAEAAYGALPLPARYGPVRHIRAALGGDVPLNTRRQQGMLYLLRQYCTQGGCGRCPLS